MGARFSIGLSRAHPGAHHGEEYRFAGRLRSERRHRGAAAGQEAYASEERARARSAGRVLPPRHASSTGRAGRSSPRTRVGPDEGWNRSVPAAGRTSSAHTLDSERPSTGASIDSQTGESLGTVPPSPGDRVLSSSGAGAPRLPQVSIGAIGTEASAREGSSLGTRLTRANVRKSPPSRIPEASVESSCEGTSHQGRQAGTGGEEEEEEEEPATRERVAAGLAGAAGAGTESRGSDGSGSGVKGTRSPPLLAQRGEGAEAPPTVAPASTGSSSLAPRPLSEPFLRAATPAGGEDRAEDHPRFHSARSLRRRAVQQSIRDARADTIRQARRPVRWQSANCLAGAEPLPASAGAALVSDYTPLEAESWPSLGSGEDSSAAGSEAAEPTAKSAHSLHTESGNSSPGGGQHGPGSQRAPSGVWLRYAAGTVAGRRPSGEVKRNQDAYLVQHRVGGIANSHLFAVMDGHGPHGHRVSGYVRRTFGDALGEQLGALPAQHLVWNPRRYFHTRKERDAELRLLAHAFRRAVTAVETRMEREKAADTTQSGSTLVAALLIGRHAVLANVGDSRCVVGRRPRESEAATVQAPDLTALAVTEDHKPSDPQERERIRRRGGVVQPLRDQQTNLPMGPARVWSPYGSGRGPGIAMSRSIGDRVAADVGVISDPVVTYHLLRPDRHRCLVLASDGVWEFMSNEEAVKAAMSSAEPSAAAVAVCQKAQRHWRDAMSAVGSRMADDITALVLHLWPDRHAAEVAAAAAGAAAGIAAPSEGAAAASPSASERHGVDTRDTAADSGAETSGARSRLQLQPRSPTSSPGSRGSPMGSHRGRGRWSGQLRLGSAARQSQQPSPSGKNGSPTGRDSPATGVGAAHS